MKSIVEQVFLNAEKAPEKIALLDGKNCMTYAQLCRQTLYAKDILRNKYGLKSEDAVILAADKQLSFVSVYLACHLLGIMVLPLPLDINSKRLNLIYAKTNPKLVIGLQGDFACGITILSDFEGYIDKYSFADVQFPDEENVADLLFTTGTTGEPKGVQLSQKNISAAALNINTFIQNNPNDVEMLALPISHSFGLGRLRCAISNGQTVVILGSFANIKKFFRFVETYQVTGFGMVPASWAMIKKLSGMKIKEYAHQLKYIEIGSAPMPLEDKKILLDNLPDTRVCMHYGLTEASRSAFIEFHEGYDHLDTIGRESPNMTIKICDEYGNNLPANTEGEICVRGNAVTSGYYKLPEINECSFWGEYFRTGDWGTIDEEGYIRLCSRKKELINVGGKKVSPLEVEEEIMHIDYVEECACIAIPDPDGVLGEVVKAYIVTKEPSRVNSTQIKNYLLGKIEAYKVPVEYEVIDVIPKTASGKVQRLLLKKK